MPGCAHHLLPHPLPWACLIAPLHQYYWLLVLRWGCHSLCHWRSAPPVHQKLHPLPCTELPRIPLTCSPKLQPLHPATCEHVQCTVGACNTAQNVDRRMRLVTLPCLIMQGVTKHDRGVRKHIALKRRRSNQAAESAGQQPTRPRRDAVMQGIDMGPNKAAKLLLGTGSQSVTSQRAWVHPGTAKRLWMCCSICIP